MRIVFVRHGHPNYADDCLTELGHEHAEAASLRLLNEGISEIHASSCGRAVETAQHTAQKLGLPVTQHDFIREIRWGAKDGSEIPHRGHPWLMALDMAQNGQKLMDPNWKNAEPFCRNDKLIEAVEAVEAGFDGWMQALGYTREGDYYRVTGENTDRTVAMFSHAGSSTAALAHLFNLPFPYMCETLAPNFTAVTVITLADDPGTLTAPRFEIANDAKHIAHMPITISN